MKTKHIIGALVLTLSSGLALAATTDAPQPPTSPNVVTAPTTPANPNNAAKLSPNAQNVLKQHQAAQAAKQKGVVQNMNSSTKPGTMPQTPSGSTQGY